MFKRCLAMTYSRMRMHTTIGAGAFHFRVRDGIGWDHAAMVAKHWKRVGQVAIGARRTIMSFVAWALSYMVKPSSN